MFAALLIFICAGSGFASANLYFFQGDDGKIYYTNVSAPGREKFRLPIKREVRGAGRVAAQSAGRPDIYEPMIASAGQSFAVDTNLIRAVIKAESNYNSRAISPKGAMGLMQLMPATAKEMGVLDPFNPEANIQGGARYLSRLLESFNGSLPLALAAYNAGPARVFRQNRIPAIAETQNYVTRVIRYYGEFSRDGARKN